MRYSLRKLVDIQIPGRSIFSNFIIKYYYYTNTFIFKTTVLSTYVKRDLAQSTLYFCQLPIMAALNKPTVLAIVDLVDRQQGTYDS